MRGAKLIRGFGFIFFLNNTTRLTKFLAITVNFFLLFLFNKILACGVINWLFRCVTVVDLDTATAV